MNFASTSSRLRPNRRQQLPPLLAILLVVCMVLTAGVLALAPAAKAEQSPWVASWGRAPSNLTNGGQCNPCSVRNTLHLTIGGSKIRLKVSNTLGETPLQIKHTTVSLPASYNSSQAIEGSMQVVTYDGEPSVELEPGEWRYSDPVDYPVLPDSDLHVSFEYAGNVRMTHHTKGNRNASYVWRNPATPVVDQLNPGPATGAWGSYYTVTDVDVLAPEGEEAPAGSVVLFGDSITDGSGATTNADERWADQLSDRINRLPAHARLGVVNAGISGNRLVTDDTTDRGQAALKRFQRDVIERAGVKSVVIFEGINDLHITPRQTDSTVLIAALSQLADTARANGISPIGATLGPWRGWRDYSEVSEVLRQEVNEWIRTSGKFDHVIDFDAMLRDANDAAKMKSDYDSGDGLHPGPRGYIAMANEIDLAILGGYSSPGTIELLSAPQLRRDVKTFVTAKITATQDTQRAQARFVLPQGWHSDNALVDLGPLAAGESAVASITAFASTPSPTQFTQVRADAVFDGLVTSKSNQITIDHNVGARDTEAPITSLTLAPTTANGSDGWYRHSPTLNITATDNSAGFIYTERRIDDGDWQVHDGELVLPEGSHTIQARSYDAEANQSEIVTALVKVDGTAPKAAATFDATKRVVTISGSDETSGVAATEYRIGSGSWLAYNQPVVLGKTSATLEYRARDRAGNIGQTKQVTVPAAPSMPNKPVSPVVPNKPVSSASVTVKAKQIKKTGRLQVTATVKSKGSVQGKKLAQVTIKRGKKTVLQKKVKVTAQGKTKVRTKKFGAGKYRVTVSFLGTATASKAKKSVSVRVK